MFIARLHFSHKIARLFKIYFNYISTQVTYYGFNRSLIQLKKKFCTDSTVES